MEGWMYVHLADCDVIYKAGGMKFPGTYEMNIQPADSASAFKVLCEPINYSGKLIKSL